MDIDNKTLGTAVFINESQEDKYENICKKAVELIKSKGLITSDGVLLLDNDMSELLDLLGN